MKPSINSVLKASSAACVIGAVLLSAPAFAKAEDANATAAAPAAPDTPMSAKADDNAIIVTGTIIRSVAAASASPIVSITADDIAKRGETTVADVVLNSAANNAGSVNASWSAFGFATGATAVSLRGFNDAYTLTLFDGLRSAVYPLPDDGYRNFVDLNTIPESIVQRIDILQDGASASYGSDAVAGVVNVIIKKEITGIHLNVSDGISQQGDAGERRADLTVGYGKLSEQGFNIYANVEYQKNDPLMLNARGFPYNTADQSSICDAAGACEANTVRNGIQAGGGYNGFQSTNADAVRPYSADGTTPLGPYQYLNGCQGLTAVTLTAAQRTATAPAVVCQQDLVKQYQQYDPKIERLGGNLHATVNIGSQAQAYAMFNFYQTKTAEEISNLAFANQTAAGGTQVTLSPLLLPVYVCPTGVGTVVPGATGCTAANGTLNPNNPFAASGQLASLSGRYILPRTTTTDAKTYRFSAGISGSFGKDWKYNIDGTTSKVNLVVGQYGNPIAQNLLNAIATGSYNFVNQNLNSQAELNYVSPPSITTNTSHLTEIQGTLAKDFLTLPGGPLTVAGGGAYRYESVNAPSPNPANNVNPYDRYYNINAVGVSGARHVWSAFYEVDAPIFDQLHLKAEGRYDDYSSGQKNFSPKFEAEFKPIKQIKLRGTYSKGFHVPSFSQSYGLPTTGYVTTSVPCSTTPVPAPYTAFCAAHASNPSYTAGTYSYGLTSAGNPGLQSEKSTSFTLGVVLQPTPRISITVDYWHTKINNIIIPATPSPAIFNQYYGNNGAVNIPGFAVTPGIPDALNQSALPLLGNITASYENADSELGEGFDFSFSAKLPLNNSGLKFISQFNASYLKKLQLSDPNTGLQVYAGTLSPCNISSCSGAPKWRFNWQNTIDFNNKGSLTLTAYYTGGYDLASTDYGGVPGDCNASIGASVVTYSDGTPIKCTTNATFDLDAHAEVKVQDHFTLYADMLNVLNNRPPYDPSAGYSIYQFNPAWGDRNFIGRYFRVGAKVDF